MTLALLICVVLSAPLFAEEPVYIPDDVLKVAIEDELGIIDPTPTDMLSLTSLRQSMERDTQMDGIRDLTGIQYAVNLQDLKLRLNRISSISHLSKLVHLEELNLSENDIDSLSALSGLFRLSDLNVHANNIESVSVLAGLGRLTELNVHDNQITDPSPLTSLKHLKDLDIHENPISDISSLEKFSQLDTLDLRHNPLNEEAHSYYIQSILNRNPGIDLGYSASLTSPLVSPVQLLASDGLFLDRVCISWSKVSTGPHFISRYQVYRTVTDAPSTEVPVSEWQTVHRFDDLAAEPGVRYDYRVDIMTERSDKPSFHHLHHSDTNTGWIGAPGSTVMANTLYVDDNAPDDLIPADSTVSDPLEDGTTSHPFDSIQEAIDRADYDTTVLVRPGTYHECLNMQGKNIRLTSFNPNANGMSPYPIIDPDYAGTALTFNKGEDQRCTVSGFIVTRGCGGAASAIACLDSSPTMRNCVIVGNRFQTMFTSAVCCVNSDSVFKNCTISDNHCGEQGAGLRLIGCAVSLTNSIMYDQFPMQILVESGDDPTVSYSTVEGTWPGKGNLSIDPQVALPGYWTGLPRTSAQWTSGDYHLMSQAGRWDPNTQNWVKDTVTSACIGVGNPDASAQAETPPNGNISNQGAYGHTGQASLSP